MRAAQQQHWNIKFTAINWIHVPVALASMLLLAAIALAALWRRRIDDVEFSQRRFASHCSVTRLSAA